MEPSCWPLGVLCWDVHCISSWVYLGVGSSVGKDGISAPKNISSEVAATFATLSGICFLVLFILMSLAVYKS